MAHIESQIVVLLMRVSAFCLLREDKKHAPDHEGDRRKAKKSRQNPNMVGIYIYSEENNRHRINRD